MNEPIPIDRRCVYLTPGGIKVTGALIDELFQPGIHVRFENGPEQAILPAEDKTEPLLSTGCAYTRIELAVGL